MAHFQLTVRACVCIWALRRCVIFIICDWLKSVIYCISVSDMHACMMLYSIYDMMGIDLPIHPHTNLHAYTQVNSKWSTQNHDTNNINISKPASASAAQIESIVYLRIWSLAVAAVIFYEFFHFKHSPNPIQSIPPSLSPHPSSWIPRNRTKNVCKFPSLFCMNFPNVTVLTYT